MKTPAYKLSTVAQSHLHNIKAYTIETYSDAQWSIYKETLIAGFQLLADNPGLGKSCDDIYPDGYYFPVGKHVAYFTKEDGFILVVAVLGQSQLPQNHLK